MNNKDLMSLPKEQILTLFKNKFKKDMGLDVVSVNMFYYHQDDKYEVLLKLEDGKFIQKLPDKAEKRSMDFMIKFKLNKQVKKEFDDIKQIQSFGLFFDLVSSEIKVCASYKSTDGEIKAVKLN
jgi:hypothetical protein